MMEHEAFGYQWIRKSTGEFYRGIHKGSPEDNYAGSGVLFNKKFGGRRRTECKDPKEWVRDVLFLGTYDECLLWESIVVTERVLEDPTCLNLVVGGNRGCIGREITEETRAKMAKSQSGRKHKPETLELMSQNNAGSNNPRYGVEVSEETRKRISAASKGRRHSEDAKLKQSEARKAWWAKRKETTMEGEVDVKQ
jgi:hypothetical protein